jgi:hypothetical protein
MKANPFLTHLLIPSSIYTAEELKQVHQLILKKEKDKMKTSDMFFCSDVLKLYNDEELYDDSGIKDRP